MIFSKNLDWLKLLSIYTTNLFRPFYGKLLMTIYTIPHHANNCKYHKLLYHKIENNIIKMIMVLVYHTIFFWKPLFQLTIFVITNKIKNYEQQYNK